MPKTKLQHSKLPWKCLYVFSPDFGENHFFMFFGDKRYEKWPNTYPEAEADARLMMASPYLLKAARTLLWQLRKNQDPSLAPYLQALQDAIARATERPEGEEAPTETLQETMKMPKTQTD